MPNGPTTPSDRPRAPTTLLVTPRSVVAAVALLGLGLVVLAVLSSSTRVLGWLLASGVVASLLSPAVTRLSAHLPRVLAFLTALVVLVVCVGGVVWLLVDDVHTQADRLRREAPAAARRIERPERWGEPARAFKLEARTRDFVRELPLTLQGGDQAAVLRATATRSVALLAAAGLLVLQAAEVVVDRRFVHPAVQVGPFLSLFALMVGLEVYGLGGALVGIAVITWLAALVVQMAPTDEDVIEASDLGIEGI